MIALTATQVNFLRHALYKCEESTVHHHKHAGDVMKIPLVRLVIPWFNKASLKASRLVAKGQIKSLFPLSPVKRIIPLKPHP